MIDPGVPSPWRQPHMRTFRAVLETRIATQPEYSRLKPANIVRLKRLGTLFHQRSSTKQAGSSSSVRAESPKVAYSVPSDEGVRKKSRSTVRFQEQLLPLDKLDKEIANLQNELSIARNDYGQLKFRYDVSRRDLDRAISERKTAENSIELIWEQLTKRGSELDTLRDDLGRIAGQCSTRRELHIGASRAVTSAESTLKKLTVDIVEPLNSQKLKCAAELEKLVDEHRAWEAKRENQTRHRRAVNDFSRPLASSGSMGLGDDDSSATDESLPWMPGRDVTRTEVDNLLRIAWAECTDWMGKLSEQHAELDKLAEMTTMEGMLKAEEIVTKRYCRLKRLMCKPGELDRLLHSRPQQQSMASRVGIRVLQDRHFDKQKVVPIKIVFLPTQWDSDDEGKYDYGRRRTFPDKPKVMPRSSHVVMDDRDSMASSEGYVEHGELETIVDAIVRSCRALFLSAPSARRAWPAVKRRQSRCIARARKMLCTEMSRTDLTPLSHVVLKSMTGGSLDAEKKKSCWKIPKRNVALETKIKERGFRSLLEDRVRGRNAVATAKSQLQNELGVWMVEESSYQERIYALNARVASLEKKLLQEQDDKDWLATIHNFFVGELATMGAQIDGDKQDLLCLQAMDAEDDPENSMMLKIFQKKLRENEARLAQVELIAFDGRNDAEHSGRAVLTGAGTLMLANRLNDGIPFQCIFSGIVKNDAGVGTEIEPCIYSLVIYEKSGQMLPGSTCPSDVTVTLLNEEEFCLRATPEDHQIPVYLFATLDEIMWLIEEFLDCDNMWELAGEKLANLLELEYINAVPHLVFDLPAKVEERWMCTDDLETKIREQAFIFSGARLRNVPVEVGIYESPAHYHLRFYNPVTNSLRWCSGKRPKLLHILGLFSLHAFLRSPDAQQRVKNCVDTMFADDDMEEALPTDDTMVTSPQVQVLNVNQNDSIGLSTKIYLDGKIHCEFLDRSDLSHEDDVESEEVVTRPGIVHMNTERLSYLAMTLAGRVPLVEQDADVDGEAVASWMVNSDGVNQRLSTKDLTVVHEDEQVYSDDEEYSDVDDDDDHEDHENHEDAMKFE